MMGNVIGDAHGRIKLCQASFNPSLIIACPASLLNGYGTNKICLDGNEGHY